MDPMATLFFGAYIHLLSAKEKRSKLTPSPLGMAAGIGGDP